MGIGQSDNLARVRGVRQDFLIATHSRIENNLTNRGALGTNCKAFKYTAIFKCQYGRNGQANLQGFAALRQSRALANRRDGKTHLAFNA
jgi:hypothetical protein